MSKKCYVIIVQWELCLIRRDSPVHIIQTISLLSQTFRQQLSNLSSLPSSHSPTSPTSPRGSPSTVTLQMTLSLSPRSPAPLCFSLLNLAITFVVAQRPCCLALASLYHLISRKDCEFTRRPHPDARMWSRSNERLCPEPCLHISGPYDGEGLDSSA